MNAYKLSFHADCMNGTENWLIVAKDLDAAKVMWEEYVQNKKVKYFWDWAVKGTRHNSGYVTWKESGDTDKESGVYKLPYNKWKAGSDHLWD